MGFGTPAAAVLEGDYSTWTKKWEWDFPDGLDDAVSIAVTMSPEHVIIAYEDDRPISTRTRFAVLNISDGSVVFLSPSGVDYQISEPHSSFTREFNYNTLASLWGGGMSFSVFVKYLILLLKDDSFFEVWKDGVKVFTSPDASTIFVGATDYGTGLIRYDGKYLIMYVYGGGNNKLVCFEGS